jgi:MFS superfamily sulfate permease-like transporter
MTHKDLSVFANLRYDIPASIVVLLVALPLCLGVALASGAPLFSGVIAGVVGGIVVGIVSKSPLSVSGPAAGLTVIVLNAIQTLPTYEAFLLAVVLAGGFQILFGVLRAGVIGDFIPSSVIKGMLAAIGLILILKQIPHAVGYDADFMGSERFDQSRGGNTFSSLFALTDQLSHGAIIISFISMAFLFWWDKTQPKFTNWLRYAPGPLAVVIFGIVAAQIFGAHFPDLAINPDLLVQVPVASSAEEFFDFFRAPDFNLLHSQDIWFIALTIAIIASIESLLSIEAVDKLDPFKRITPTNRELMAQGVGNITCGMLGGIPVTSVIVRSSANVNSGARTKLSTITHGLLLLICVISIPSILNLIPLSALAAVLIVVGYKLTKPRIFVDLYNKGAAEIVPFVVTILAILLTDLLKGIAIGVVVGIAFVIIHNFRSSVLFIQNGHNYLVRPKKDLYFIHKYELRQKLNKVPSQASVMVDLTRASFVDRDNIEIINDFIINAGFRDITIHIKSNPDCAYAKLIKVNTHEAA